jgi:GNAT superfamily N-acetyltransferase
MTCNKARAARLALKVEHHRGARPLFAARLGLFARNKPMDHSFLDRIDATGASLPLTPSEFDAALRQGEALHRDFRPNIQGDYGAYLQRMAAEGAGVMQLVDAREVRAIAVWRSYLTTYCGRRFEIDDLVTSEQHRSKGYGQTIIRALEAKAHLLSCDVVMLVSATRRVDAHRFYHRERYVIGAFLFGKELR